MNCVLHYLLEIWKSNFTPNTFFELVPVPCKRFCHIPVFLTAIALPCLSFIYLEGLERRTLVRRGELQTSEVYLIKHAAPLYWNISFVVETIKLQVNNTCFCIEGTLDLFPKGKNHLRNSPNYCPEANLTVYIIYNFPVAFDLQILWLWVKKLILIIQCNQDNNMCL